MADKPPSRRAQRVWKRLTEWYGARFTDQFGLVIPPDWAAVVDDADNDTVKLVLAEISKAHVTHPPTFPEFDAVFTRCKRPRETGPGNAELLCDWVLANKSLTVKQRSAPWTYVGQRFDAVAANGKIERNHGVRITGVIVPADGDHTGYRVTLEDLQLGACEAFAPEQPALV